jgi:hypothetical protein
MRFLTLFAVIPLGLFSSVHTHAEQGAPEQPNYCHDTEVNQQWSRLVQEAPSDDILMRLFALRLGLCQLVNAGLLDLDRATEIFEQVRMGAAVERRHEEEEKRDDEGLQS